MAVACLLDFLLPSELRDWLALAAPGARRTVRRSGSTLTVEAAGDFVLAMRERGPDDLPLTRREREILGLVADGLTNAEIARALWVAPTTVAKHLEHACSKLGVHSRTAAVARVAQLSGSQASMSAHEQVLTGEQAKVGRR